jgi:murein DD-endopeptidase MepM/ murein hydrolase activator NlpD
VRFFPRAARVRVFAAFITAALIGVSTTSLPWAFADELDDKQDQVQQDIEDTQQDLQESSERAARAHAALQSAQTKLVDANARLATARAELAKAKRFDVIMQRRLALSEARLRAANQATAMGQVSVELQTIEVRKMITGQVQQGNADLIATLAIIDSKTPQELVLNLGARDAIVAHQNLVYDKLEKAKAELAERQNDAATATEEVARDRQLAAENLERMQALEAEASQVQAEIQDLVSQRASAQREASAARAADQTTLDALQAEEERIAELLRKRDDKPTGPVDGSGVLMYPVSGSVTSPYGWRVHPIYKYWGLHDGVDFGAGCGAPLYAATSGTVVSSYWSGVYGNRLVIDHGIQRGVPLGSIYNHASSYTVGVGSQVSRGQVIGYVGSTGWSTGCHLHYTVMVNGSTVDPMNWF